MADNDAKTGPAGNDAGPVGAPLDQPTTPQQRAQMFASDPPVEFDPLGQSLITAPIDIAVGVARFGTHLLEHATEEIGDFLLVEAAEYVADKAADAGQDGGGADQGASASDQRWGDDQPADDMAPAQPDTTQLPPGGPGIGQTR